jgi:signal transduction histidine kinase/phage shock protein PspC (stress-responsive transcriptional regulator)
MIISGPHPASTVAPPARQARKATRSADDAYLGGVAGGLAAHLGVHPSSVRAFFLLTSPFGLGVLLYAGLWLALPLAAVPEERSPGLDAATRRGLRPRRPHEMRDAGFLVALGVVVVGIAGLLNASFGGGLLSFWPLVLAAVGVMVLWRQADEAQRERWWDATGGLDVRRIFLGAGGAAAWARLAAGIGLLVVALLLFAAETGKVAAAREVVIAGTVGVLGLAITLGPWLIRIASDLGAERTARIRSQERADVAAHLHDSVLQTLALIQRSADDPVQVARLARAQERDLREWMYGGTATGTKATLVGAVRAAAVDVEDQHGVPVEVVTVGDAPRTAQLGALVAAAREAMVNAAKHSGADQVQVYAEVEPAQVTVFVRDRGAGFDPEAVPADRYGLAQSVVGRMERNGGKAVVRSAPGEGTEVQLEVPRG